MLKLTAFIASIPLIIGVNAANAAILGPYAASCQKGSQTPAILVHVEGLKNRNGTLRVQAYEADQKVYFEKGKYLNRVEMPLPSEGTIDVCLTVPKAGDYTVLVRHKNGDSDREDGGGFSGNPSMSLMDVALKHKPPLKASTITVSNSVLDIKIIMKYIQGLSFKPIASAGQDNKKSEVTR
ncbi:MAG: DUF2141 domain-containing protein [Zymomonas mobilis]|uniref:Uncharacterized protein DUF2141 n=1 Tax=Zymomonas mobilis TaxID=542 RepID=A0A542W2D0_ZYMMB|nr:DUF2141 domain-containing protein [Zymomonas mobilis]TQL17723.1 uncharacterized protein DUF2141 [Zymomonas mobilis]